MSFGKPVNFAKKALQSGRNPVDAIFDFLCGGVEEMGRLKRKMREQFGRCYYCHRKIDSASATEDHKMPKSRGGQEIAQNIVAACWPCNLQKQSMTAEEYRDYRRKLKLDFPQALDFCFCLLEKLSRISTNNPQRDLLRGLLLELVRLLEEGAPETDRNVVFIWVHIARLAGELHLINYVGAVNIEHVMAAHA
jgi:HNH endonuclease